VFNFHQSAVVSLPRAVLVIASLLCNGTVEASVQKGTARAAMQLFADHCFSPFMTAQKAAKTFALSGAWYDFYDLDPFSSAEPSPATGRAVTPGTDRRCEIAFAGDYAEAAAQAATDALNAEGITKPAPLPAIFAPDTGTKLLAARQLNPRRTAIVHVGTRQGPQGTETFMLVERLMPSNKDQN
jgi:hypothetical protein